MVDATVKMLSYLALAMFGTLIVIGSIINYRKKELLPTFGKYALGLVIGFSISTISILLYQTWLAEVEIGTWGLEKDVFYPIFALFLFGIALIIGGIFISHLKKSLMRPYALVSFIAVTIYVIVLLIVIPFRKDDGTEYTSGEKGGLITSVLVAIMLLVLVPLFFGKKTPIELNTKAVVYAAICIALGFALSYLKVFSFPTGGSITIAGLLPIIIYSFMFGIRRGVTAGIIFGFLQFIQEPYFLDTWQFLLEYPIAFGMIGLAGLFHDLKLFEKMPLVQLVLGGIIVGILRFVCHFIAGVIVWKMYAPADMPATTYSLTYNLVYVFPDIAISIVLGGIMFSTKNVRQLVFNVVPKEQSN